MAFAFTYWEGVENLLIFEDRGLNGFDRISVSLNKPQKITPNSVSCIKSLALQGTNSMGTTDVEMVCEDGQLLKGSRIKAGYWSKGWAKCPRGL